MATRLLSRKQRPSPDAMTLVEHLSELRRRLIIMVAAVVTGATVAAIEYPNLLKFLQHPYCRVNPGHCGFYVTGPLDGLSLRIQIALFGGLVLYCVRCRQWPLLAASLVAGTIGGIGFSGGACVEALLQSFGNANLAPGLAEPWTNWQNSQTDIPVSIVMLAAQPIHHWEFWLSANWHSFLEQTYGFVNGLAVIAAMAVLWRRLERSDDSGPREYWTEVVAVSIVVPVLMWVTLQKDVAEWTQGPPAAVPETMRMPLFGYSLSAWGWFNVIFGIAAME